MTQHKLKLNMKHVCIVRPQIIGIFMILIDEEFSLFKDIMMEFLQPDILIFNHTSRYLNNKFSSLSLHLPLHSRSRGRDAGTLPYIGYLGICRWPAVKGRVFEQFALG